MLALRSILSVLALPVVVTIVIPALLLLATPEREIDFAFGTGRNVAVVVLALALVGGGVSMLVWTVSLFARRGRGTLAPWDPPRRLVVQGPYRHVRNPMITGVIAILMGEALLTASAPVLGWFVFFALLNAIVIPMVEEPQLRRRFGDDYATYTANVPRWLPRVRAWRPRNPAGE